MKVVAIAGASSGVGKAVTLALARRGYSVCYCARRKPLLDELSETIAEEGGNGLGIRADMTKWEDAQRFIERTVNAFGRVDVLINNAGAGVRYTEFENLSVDEIMDGVAINLLTTLFGCKAVLPIMKQQLSGHIINTTSILGKRARAGLAVYTAAKHGVDGFSRSLFNEVKKYNIKVSIIGPGLIATEWSEKAGINATYSAGALKAEDVAEAMRCIIETPLHFSIWSMDLMSLDQVIDPL